MQIHSHAFPFTAGTILKGLLEHCKFFSSEPQFSHRKINWNQRVCYSTFLSVCVKYLQKDSASFSHSELHKLLLDLVKLRKVVQCLITQLSGAT